MKHEPSGARLLPANPLAAGLVAGEATAEGHAALAAQLDTSIATGEMLTSVAEHWDLIRNKETRINNSRQSLDAPRGAMV